MQQNGLPLWWKMRNQQGLSLKHCTKTTRCSKVSEGGAIVRLAQRSVGGKSSIGVPALHDTLGVI